jgi:hypothetical protein
LRRQPGELGTSLPVSASASSGSSLDRADSTHRQHWTEDSVRGHIAICVLAAVIEAVIADQLAAASVRDPDLPDQTISARRALAELDLTTSS